MYVHYFWNYSKIRQTDKHTQKHNLLLTVTNGTSVCDSHSNIIIIVINCEEALILSQTASELH